MTSLFVDRRDVHLQLDAGALVFRENGERIGTVPLAPLSRVILRGSVTLDASVLGKLGDNGVGVVILSGRQGKPSLMLSRPHNDASRRVQQTRRSLDPDFCLHYARQLIHTKLARQSEWLDQLRHQYLPSRYELSRAIRLLEEHQQRLPEIQRLDSLRGLEGSAASIYFEGLRSVVPASLQFTHRNRRPPRDPFNVLLSLTYTLVNAEIAIALHAAGFDPYIGYYHQLSFGRESLACDLLETLRPLADSFCLELVKKTTLTKDHFSQTSSGCLLGKAGRIHYYQAWEQHSETLRRAIQHSIEELVQTLHSPATTTPCANTPLPPDANLGADHAIDTVATSQAGEHGDNSENGENRENTDTPENSPSPATATTSETAPPPEHTPIVPPQPLDRFEGFEGFDDFDISETIEATAAPDHAEQPTLD